MAVEIKAPPLREFPTPPPLVPLPVSAIWVISCPDTRSSLSLMSAKDGSL